MKQTKLQPLLKVRFKEWFGFNSGFAVHIP